MGMKSLPDLASRDLYAQNLGRGFGKLVGKIANYSYSDGASHN